MPTDGTEQVSHGNKLYIASRVGFGTKRPPALLNPADAVVYQGGDPYNIAGQAPGAGFALARPPPARTGPHRAMTTRQLQFAA